MKKSYTIVVKQIEHKIIWMYQSDILNNILPCALLTETPIWRRVWKISTQEHVRDTAQHSVWLSTSKKKKTLYE
jgi:hypothetical protein